MHGVIGVDAPARTRPDWFPDWSGEVAALVGAGESATPEAVAALRGRCRVLVINNSFRLAPWADALYACDGRWWSCPDYRDALDFAGLKITQDRNAAKHHKIKLVELVEHDRPEANTLIVDRPGIIGRGNNGGFQGLNLLLQFGVKRIVSLIDCAGKHWHEDHPVGLRNARAHTLAKWAATFDAQAPLLASLGITLINVSPISALAAYPKMTIAEAFDRLDKVG